MPKTAPKRCGCLVHKIAERSDVLMQLAIGHEGAVAAEVERHGGAGDLLRLVGIAEQEFAGRERPPIALAIDCAIASRDRLLVLVWILPFENRIAERVGEAEMFLRRGTVSCRPSERTGSRSAPDIAAAAVSGLIVTGQKRYAADRLASASISAVFVSSAGTALPSRIHLRVERDENMHGVRIECRAVVAALGPHLVPGLFQSAPLKSSPSIGARAAMPSMNSSGMPRNVRVGIPSASSPYHVKAILTVTSGRGTATCPVGMFVDFDGQRNAVVIFGSKAVTNLRPESGRSSTWKSMKRPFGKPSFP